MHRIVARQAARDMVMLTDFDSPYKFEAPWHAFEFGFHILEVQPDLVIINMAWLTREEGRMFSRMPSEVSLSQTPAIVFWPISWVELKSITDDGFCSLIWRL